MTEYRGSPEAITQFMSSRERTAHWVRAHSPTGLDFYSPSVPPLELPSTPISPPSEVESTHSLPPTMVLKYRDGRPDVPISHWHHNADPPSTGPPRRGDPAASLEHSAGHSRSRSHNPVLEMGRGRSGYSGHHHRQRDVSPPFPHAPEEIRVWPSDSDDVPRTYPRSKSLPREAYAREDVPPPPLPPLQPRVHPVPMQNMYQPHHAQLRPNLRTNTAPQPRPMAWHSSAPAGLVQAPHTRPVVYGHGQPFKNYHPPPAQYRAHPYQGPEGMRLTRSAPVPYQGAYEPHQPVIPIAATSLSSVDEEKYPRRGARRTRARTPETEEESGDSESTYYVVPTPPKMHSIGPDKSMVYTATSTTQSPISPSSRKPFFHRLFGMFAPTPSDSSRASSAGNRRLQRRHSTGRRHHEQRVH